MARKSTKSSSKSTKSAAKTPRASRLAPLGFKSREELLAKVRSVKLSDGAKIKVLAKENPKRGKSAKRFSIYKNGMTVAAAIEKGALRGDLRWDAAHKYIALQ